MIAFSPLSPFSEHWDGTRWSIITTPSGVADLNDVTALSDGTVGPRHAGEVTTVLFFVRPTTRIAPIPWI